MHLFLGCKKEPKETITKNSNTTGAGSTNILPNGNGPDTCDAVLQITKGYYKTTSSFQPSNINNCLAYLCAQPIINDIAYNRLDMGEVSLNGKVFKSFYSSLNYYYNDTTYSSYSTPYIWNISGSVNIDTQIDTCTTQFPVYSGTSYLPDSISKSQGITITINNLSNCDFYRITLVGPSGSQYLAPKMYPGNATSISFVPNELMGMTTGSTGLMLITFYKDNVKNIASKNLNFRLGVSYSIYNFKITA
ncbi:MAG: hypothetical protein IPG89_01000 [Bacteroidetes bacterium]|nr:hypothetical protein [Bacteroidota bacterium]